MSVTAELLSINNPHSAVAGHRFSQLNKPRFPRSPFALKFESLLRPISCRASIEEAAPIGLGFHSLERRRRLIVPFAASHEESHSEIEVEKETDNIKSSEESQEEWKQALASFKEQALKIQSVSQEAYEIYSKKAIIMLKEYSEQLQIQAEKAKNDLTVVAKEIREEGKEYLSKAAKNYPEPVKEVVETFSSSSDELTEISKVRDFYLGIPYGLLLTVGGFLSFMLTGSLSAIRFGVILGGTLLALSVSSLRSYKRREPYALALKGQTVIAAILFLREICFLLRGGSFFSVLTTVISAAMVAFYVYRIALDGKQSKGTDWGYEAEN